MKVKRFQERTKKKQQVNTNINPKYPKLQHMQSCIMFAQSYAPNGFSHFLSLFFCWKNPFLPSSMWSIMFWTGRLFLFPVQCLGVWCRFVPSFSSFSLIFFSLLLILEFSIFFPHTVPLKTLELIDFRWWYDAAMHIQYAMCILWKCVVLMKYAFTFENKFKPVPT